MRAMPRTRAAATAIPVAAERKLCRASATICEKIGYGRFSAITLQLVLVVKLAAVLKARSGLKPGSLCGLSGR